MDYFSPLLVQYLPSNPPGNHPLHRSSSSRILVPTHLSWRLMIESGRDRWAGHMAWSLRALWRTCAETVTKTECNSKTKLQKHFICRRVKCRQCLYCVGYNTICMFTAFGSLFSGLPWWLATYLLCCTDARPAALPPQYLKNTVGYYCSSLAENNYF